MACGGACADAIGHVGTVGCPAPVTTTVADAPGMGVGVVRPMG